MPINILNKTKTGPPISGLFLNKLKKEVLGEKYDLSLVFIGESLSKKLNKKYRKKKGATDVLSFPLAKNKGEIFINLKKAKKEAPAFNLSYKYFISYLFLHSLLHLKGFKHGKTMSKKEFQLRKKFNF